MTIVKKAYKFRIYPTLEQITFFSKNFGCVRKVHNLMLDDRKKVYEEYKSTGIKTKYPTPAKYKIALMEWEHDTDHIHLLISATPVTELSKFINAYKSASSRLIKKEFPIIKSKLWKEYFWSRSFLVLSVGGASIEVIKKYIQGQGGENENS